MKAGHVCRFPLRCLQRDPIFRLHKMHQAHLTDSVRRQITQVFVDLGDIEPVELRETIMIRDGSYCGRRFEGRAASAVWFAEENQIKVFRADGTIARVVEARKAGLERAA
jgi:hypothetical protein